MCRINKQREIIVLDRQGTQQQRPESSMVTPPGVQVNYIQSSTFRGCTFGGIYIPWWNLYTLYLLARQVELL